jgi:hypothetical protein
MTRRERKQALMYLDWYMHMSTIGRITSAFRRFVAS